MKMMKSCVYGALGSCCVLAALVPGRDCGALTKQEEVYHGGTEGREELFVSLQQHSAAEEAQKGSFKRGRGGSHSFFSVLLLRASVVHLLGIVPRQT